MRHYNVNDQDEMDEFSDESEEEANNAITWKTGIFVVFMSKFMVA